MRKIRNTNIEILRILSILGVIILHYNNENMGGALAYTSDLALNKFILLFFECLSICSVNLFVLITGYFMCHNNNRNAFKPLKLIIEVVFFSLFFYAIEVLSGAEELSVDIILDKCVPNNYFVILYVALYGISPYINIMLKNLSEYNFRKLIITLISLFSIYPAVIELFSEITGTSISGLSTIGMYGSQYGYTIINFALMYIIGAYIKINDIKLKGKIKNTLLYLLCAIGLLSWYYLGYFCSKDTSGSALAYFNPLCIYEAVLLFMLFKDMKINNSRIANFMASGTFVVFLIHTNFIRFTKIEWFVVKSPIIMLCHLLISVIFIYCASTVVYFVYHMTFEKIIDYILRLHFQKV